MTCKNRLQHGYGDCNPSGVFWLQVTDWLQVFRNTSNRASYCFVFFITSLVTGYRLNRGVIDKHKKGVIYNYKEKKRVKKTEYIKNTAEWVCAVTRNRLNIAGDCHE